MSEGTCWFRLVLGHGDVSDVNIGEGKYTIRIRWLTTPFARPGIVCWENNTNGKRKDMNGSLGQKVEWKCDMEKEIKGERGWGL